MRHDQRIAELEKAARMACDAIDWQLNVWDAERDGALPGDLLDAYAALLDAMGDAATPPSPQARMWLRRERT